MHLNNICLYVPKQFEYNIIYICKIQCQRNVTYTAVISSWVNRWNIEFYNYSHVKDEQCDSSYFLQSVFMNMQTFFYRRRRGKKNGLLFLFQAIKKRNKWRIRKLAFDSWHVRFDAWCLNWYYDHDVISHSKKKKKKRDKKKDIDWLNRFELIFNASWRAYFESVGIVTLRQLERCQEYPAVIASRVIQMDRNEDFLNDLRKMSLEKYVRVRPFEFLTREGATIINATLITTCEVTPV